VVKPQACSHKTPSRSFGRRRTNYRDLNASCRCRWPRSNWSQLRSLRTGGCVVLPVGGGRSTVMGRCDGFLAGVLWFTATGVLSRWWTEGRQSACLSPGRPVPPAAAYFTIVTRVRSLMAPSSDPIVEWASIYHRLPAASRRSSAPSAAVETQTFLRSHYSRAAYSAWPHLCSNF